MKKAFLFLIALSITSVQGQTYYEYTHEATELYNAKKYQQSSKAWESAFFIQKGFSSDYYNSACTNALAGNTDKAFDHLEKSIKNGWEDIEWLQKDTDFALLKESEKWSDFLNDIPRFQNQYLRSLNVKLKQSLEDLRMQDQTIRLLLPEAEKKFGRNSKEYNWFRTELMPRNDSIVLHEITKVLENKGWPGISEVGELANQTLWLVLQHAPLEVQEMYFHLLEKSVEIGESKAEYLAFLQDRILMRKGENQIYGTQSIWNKEKSKNVIWPIADFRTINQRRKMVGLISVEDYAKNNGYLLDAEPQN